MTITKTHLSFFEALQSNAVLIDSDIVAATRLLWLGRAQELDRRYKVETIDLFCNKNHDEANEKIMAFFNDLGEKEIFPSVELSAFLFRSPLENLFQHERRGRLLISQETVKQTNAGISGMDIAYLPEYIVEVGYFGDGTNEFCVRLTYLSTDKNIQIMDFIKKAIDGMNLKEKPSFITKAATNGNSISYSNVELDTDRLAHDEFYPFLPVDMETYIAEYLKSDAPVLILLGPPGTGKSTLVRTILSRIEGKTMLCNDVNALKSGGVMDKVRTNKYDALAMEDVDVLLKPRSEGNDFMATLLDESEGIAKSDLRIMVSTNLGDVDAIDKALTREGRTFDILTFRELTYDESVVVAEKMKLPSGDLERRDHTLTQVFSLNRPSFTLFSERKTKKLQMGFTNRN